MMNIGHWTSQLPPFDINDYLGFVYKITLSCGKFYVGRKNFWSAVTKPPLKGKTRKRRSKKESDWASYTSSSVHVNELVTQHRASGTHIKFEIIHLCKSKSEMSYFEVHYIITTRSMLDEMGLNFNASRIPCKPK